MGNDDKNDEQQSEQAPFGTSIRLQLTASIVSTISNVLGILAVLEAIEEEKVIVELEQKEQKELHSQLANMQAQIDRLTNELDEMKSRIEGE
jgi:peptidoglycan hydrolase CwlO-like protein